MEPKKVLVNAALAAFLFGTSQTQVLADDHVAGGKFECAGINGCKGKGECGGKDHGCAGKNECKGKGFLHTADKAECDKKTAEMKQGGHDDHHEHKAKSKKKG